jgi:hypothetical protein
MGGFFFCENSSVLTTRRRLYVIDTRPPQVRAMLSKINAFRAKVSAVKSNVRAFTAQLDRTLQRLNDVAEQHERDELIARQVCWVNSFSAWMLARRHTSSIFVQYQFFGPLYSLHDLELLSSLCNRRSNSSSIFAPSARRPLSFRSSRRRSRLLFNSRHRSRWLFNSSPPRSR